MKHLIEILLMIIGIVVFVLTSDDNVIAGMAGGIIFGAGLGNILVDKFG